MVRENTSTLVCRTWPKLAPSLPSFFSSLPSFLPLFFQTIPANSVGYICFKIQSAAQGQYFVCYTKVLKAHEKIMLLIAESQGNKNAGYKIITEQSILNIMKCIA